jgi:hypothetical protein
VSIIQRIQAQWHSQQCSPKSCNKGHYKYIHTGPDQEEYTAPVIAQSINGTAMTQHAQLSLRNSILCPWQPQCVQSPPSSATRQPSPSATSLLSNHTPQQPHSSATTPLNHTLQQPHPMHHVIQAFATPQPPCSPPCN